MDFFARSVHDPLPPTGDKLDFDDERTTRGNLLVLGDGRRLGEIRRDARQTVDFVGRRVGSASRGTAESTSLQDASAAGI
ncbi:MAG: hypothetical protein F4Y47_08180 [Acidobacteriia bacterium]|nr:hypothetical protein [Terriglobia bacterium]MYG04563.1 hypothetical protein [Terriglobia bacterium]MYK11822.1 hypothetical protein [Terriglobia bacterium]